MLHVLDYDRKYYTIMLCTIKRRNFLYYYVTFQTVGENVYTSNGVFTLNDTQVIGFNYFGDQKCSCVLCTSL